MIDNFIPPERAKQPTYGAMKAHLQEHSLCVLRSGLASSHLASDNSQRDEVSRRCSANVLFTRGRILKNSPGESNHETCL